MTDKKVFQLVSKAGVAQIKPSISPEMKVDLEDAFKLIMDGNHDYIVITAEKNTPNFGFLTDLNLADTNLLMDQVKYIGILGFKISEED